jgi:predicted dehydrogenase
MTHGIGFIGLGIMGQRMLEGLALNPRVTPALAWDPDPQARQRALGRHPGLAIADSAEAVMSDPRVACVYIASPPASHLAHAGQAFDRGKAVFSEKPLAVDLEQSRQAAARVEDEGLRAAINFPFASAPAATALAREIASGAVGRIERVEIETVFAEWPRPWQRDARWLVLKAEGGFVREVVSHFLFLTRRILGPIAVRSSEPAYPGPGRAETAIEAELAAGGVPIKLAGGVRGAIADSNRWTVHGATGALQLRDWVKLERREGAGWVEIDLGPGELRSRSVKAQLDGLADMIEEKPHRLASFREGWEVQVAVERLLGNAALGAERIRA